jgi:predicted component of type VI protein secretion system
MQLQEDKDFHHWGVDFHSIYWRARHHGGMDFDPHTLRRVLPSAVRVIDEALQAGKRWAAVHATFAT